MVRAYRWARFVGLAATAVLAIGTFLPWIVATDPDLGVTVGRPGIDAGTSGLTVLVFAIVAAIALYVRMPTAAWIAAGAGFIALALTGQNLHPSESLISYLGLPGVAEVGVGVYVCVAAALVIVAVGAFGGWALRDE